MLTQDYDIAIIGLGVAGSNVARLLDKRFKILAIDKKLESGDCFDSGFHKPCGGLLSKGAQKVFAKQNLNVPKDVLANPQIFAINTIDIASPHASYIQKCYVNMERHRFDMWLKSLVPDSVTCYHNAACKAIARESSGLYHITFKQNDEIFSAKAKLIIGADGAQSVVKRTIYPHIVSKHLVCIQAWYKNTRNKDMLTCIFDSALSPSYAWSMAKDGYFIFGGAYTYKNAFAKFSAQLAKLSALGFDFSNKIKLESCLVRYARRFSDFKRGENGAFLIGEAAGFVNFATLEGISGAMQSAKILASILNNYSAEDLANSTTIAKLHRIYQAKTRTLVLKTLLRAYMRYPFMFLPPLRRMILRFGILRVRAGLKDNNII